MPLCLEAMPQRQMEGMGHWEGGALYRHQDVVMVGMMSHSWVGCVFVPSPLPKCGLGAARLSCIRIQEVFQDW